MYSDWKLNELPSNTSVAWPSSIRTPRTQYSENCPRQIIDTVSNTFFCGRRGGQAKAQWTRKVWVWDLTGSLCCFLGGIFPLAVAFSKSITGYEELTKCWGVTCDDLASYLGEREGLILLYASCRRNLDELLKIFLIVSPSYGLSILVCYSRQTPKR